MIISACADQNGIHSSVDYADVSVQNSGDIVLTVGGRTATAAELGPSLDRADGDSVMVNLRVDALVSRMLILQDAQNRGFDSTRDAELYAYEREREKLQNLWIDRILQEKVSLPPDTVEQFYSQMGTVVRYSAVTVRDRALCDSLRQLVRDGHNMGDLVAQYSTDLMEKANRGILGPMDMMEAPLSDLGLLRDLEVGEISPVDSFSSGWRFVRLDSIHRDSVPPIDEIRAVISSRILGGLRMDYRDVLFDSLRSVNNLRMEEGITGVIAEHFPQDSPEYEPFTPEQENSIAYTFTGGERTLYSLVENIRSLPMIPGNDPGNPEWIKEYIQLLGLYDIMAMEAKTVGMDTMPEVVSFMEHRVSNYVLDVYYAEVIEPRLIPSRSDIMEIYEAARDTLFIPEGRIFKAISAFGEDQLSLMQQVLDSEGDPFSMIEEFTLVPNLLAPGEFLVTVPMSASGIPSPYSEMLFEAEMNETVICSIAPERILVFEVIGINPEHNATFDESEGWLTEAFISSMEEEVISALVDSLSSVYHIEIDREFVNGFIYADPGIDVQP